MARFKIKVTERAGHLRGTALASDGGETRAPGLASNRGETRTPGLASDGGDAVAPVPRSSARSDPGAKRPLSPLSD